MSDDPTRNDDSGAPLGAPAVDVQVGRLAHEMNNAVAYIITNLNLLTEEIEHLPMPSVQRARLLRFLDEASDGGMRVSDLIRQMKVLSWGDTPASPVDGDDTWDATEGPKRVLVVDDEPAILTAVHRALKSYDVVVTSSGAEALEHLQDGSHFDLILCDLVMPEMSGIELHRTLSARDATLGDKMVFMTAGAFTTEARDFLSKVRNPVLHKPFDTKTLRWILAQARRQG
jgi:CheY-like chemotaxis protein